MSKVISKRTVLKNITLGLAAVAVAGGVSIGKAYAADPVENVTDALKLEWKTETTGKKIHIAPLRTKNRVITVPDNGPMYALDAKTGKVAWTYNGDNGVWNRGFSSDGTRVFVCEKGAGFSALDVETGKRLWHKNLGINCQRPQLSADGVTYVVTTRNGPGIEGSHAPTNDAKLFALESATGKTKWEFQSTSYLIQTPSLANGVLYTGGTFYRPEAEIDEGGNVRFYAIDAKTGKSVWEVVNEDGTPKAIHYMDGKVVYIGYQDFVVALDAKDGKMVWRRDTGNWTPSIAVRNGLVYESSATRKVEAWKVEDGSTKWSFRIQGPAFNYLLIKPLFVNGRMYFISQRGQVHALDPDTGAVHWIQGTGVKNHVGIEASEDGYVYVGDAVGVVHAYKVLR